MEKDPEQYQFSKIYQSYWLENSGESIYRKPLMKHSKLVTNLGKMMVIAKKSNDYIQDCVKDDHVFFDNGQCRAKELTCDGRNNLETEVDEF
ncbi:hypothetical protein CEXT_781891 [Caerostris extrusa]|uniref:Uncharacterized protein n=1 Tax=Caerostris extrusa TaxID=172846 RepID=A0AAV4VDA2_CAEEX|nr:hypothetical protein CEXT_781891 [Caerostris extrusa]